MYVFNKQNHKKKKKQKIYCEMSFVTIFIANATTAHVK